MGENRGRVSGKQYDLLFHKQKRAGLIQPTLRSFLVELRGVEPRTS